MELKVIYTDRYFLDWPSWHIIYEWEDILSEHLSVKLIDSRKASVITKYTDKALRYISRQLYGSSNKMLPVFDRLIYKKEALYFEILVRGAYYFTGSKNTIPVIIDFWKGTDLDTFYQAYRNCRAILISNIEVYNFLKDNKFPINIYHFPLSLPDKYRLSGESAFDKIYDIIVPGRSNPVLWGYLMEYEKKFPDVEYIYPEQVDGEFYYVSNKSGRIGKFNKRDEYINLLRSAKVGFYSTPGIDGDEERTGGFGPVTPRFLEMVAAGCKIIARYPQSAETAFYEMNKVCISCDNYSQFEQELSNALNSENSCFAQNEVYLEKHYTSARIDLLKSILSQIN
jgi:hypothetical protein